MQQIQAKQSELKRLSQKNQDLQEDLIKSNEDLTLCKQSLNQTEALFQATQIKLSEKNADVNILNNLEFFKIN